ncbi:MAG: virB6 2 [Rickettsiaceae bacterium]|jgi:type IV secretion system protein VirB6|nr:virB6 2 [Rickettsiaceae bacterium]
MKNKALKSLLYVILALYTSSSFASFGNSCELFPINANYEKLKSSNVYGYVVSQIDTRTYVPADKGCNVFDGTITICLATPGTINANPPCELKTFNNGQTTKLFSDSEFTTQSPNHPLKDAVFYSKIVNSMICIFMQTSEGEVPLACKKTSPGEIYPEQVEQQSCKVSRSCYDPDSNHSKSFFNYSGKAVHCVKETLDKVLNPEQECLSEDNEVFLNINPFSYFQLSLKNAVRAALMIYVIFFGFKLLMNPEKVELEAIVTLVLKVVLVTYFAVGLGTVSYTAGGSRPNDGITQFALPILIQILTDFPNMIFQAAETLNICHFEPNEYPAGYGFYSLWDALDCRLQYYVSGMGHVDSAGAFVAGADLSNNEFNSSSPFKDKLAAGGASAAIFLMLLGGQVILLVFVVIFMVVIMSLMLYFVSTFLICLTSIYVMAYIAPIFVPLALFEKTKAYFDSWLRVTISFALQPMILAAFMVILMVFYDEAVFGGCHFNDPFVGEDGIKHYQFADANGECKETFGYKLTEIVAQGKGVEEFSASLFKVYGLRNVAYLLLDALFLAFLSFVFFFFSQVLSQFAADLTGGIQTGAIAIDPTLIMRKSIAAAKAARSAYKAVKSIK